MEEEDVSNIGFCTEMTPNKGITVELGYNELAYNETSAITRTFKSPFFFSYIFKSVFFLLYI